MIYHSLHHHHSFGSLKSGMKRVLMLGIMSLSAIGMFWYLQQFGFRFFASEDPVTVLISAPDSIDLSDKDAEEFAVGFTIQDQEVLGSQLILTYDSTYIQYGKEYQDSGFIRSESSPYDVLAEEVSVVNEKTKRVKLIITVVSPLDPADPMLRFSFKAKPNSPDESIVETPHIISLTTESEYFGKSSGGTAVKFATPLEPISKTILISKKNQTVTPLPSPSVETTEPPASPILSPDPTDLISRSPQGPGADSLLFRITLQGIDASKTLENEIPVSVSILDQNGPVRTIILNFKKDQNLSWTARWEGSALPKGGEYSIRIKGPKHIARKICDVKPREAIPGTYRCEEGSISFVPGENVIDTTNIVLLSGDILPQDGIVDARDIVFIRQNFGNRDQVVVKRADLNYDGIVDTQDYVLIQSALAFKYDEN